MPLSRRHFLHSTTLAVAGATLGFPRRAAAINTFEAPVTISVSDAYHGWPTIARTRSAVCPGLSGRQVRENRCQAQPRRGSRAALR